MKVGTIKKQMSENSGAGIANLEIQEMFKTYHEEDELNKFDFINAVINKI